MEVDQLDQCPTLTNPLICLGDGHDGICNVCDLIGSAPQRFEILDWSHLKENLYKVGGSLSNLPKQGYLFPGKNGQHLTHQAADLALRKAGDYIGLRGVSTHSFRRTAVTRLYHAGVDLKTLQK